MKQADIDKWIELGTLRERQSILKLINEFAANTDYPEVESTLEHLQDAIKGGQK